MRPRHYAADNMDAGHFTHGANSASMRPRHYAADNRITQDVFYGNRAASMRPRHYAADNKYLIPSNMMLAELQ